MNKQKIAFIGNGGCGNKLLDALLSIDPRYHGIYSNTNIEEMKDLKHYSSSNSLYFPSGQGTGRDRETAKTLMKQDQAQIIDFFTSKFPAATGINNYFIATSTDGGSGSGSTMMIAKVIKKAVNPKAKVNVLAAMGDLKGNIASLKNTKGFWQDLLNGMKQGVIDSVQFIDNNKMIDENTFNHMVMKEFDDSISINANEIDIVDSEKVNTVFGYKVTLKLDPEIKDIKKAIEDAKIRSNFIIPEDIDECENLMVSVNEGSYDKAAFQNLFKVYNLDKYDYNKIPGKNMIVMGGVEMPKEYIQMINDELNNRESSRQQRNLLSDDLFLNEEIAITTNNKKDIADKEDSVSKDELLNMMKSDDFWD